jgi:hypothetical protein
MTDTQQCYDLIGDVHGEADKLVALLSRLGYSELGGRWRHPSRMAIFVGDFISRGPKQLATISIVRSMIEGGAALAVLGNHELYAIAWHTADPENPGEYLRPRFASGYSNKFRNQQAAFLAEIEHQPELHKDIIDWFMSLPLWLDLPGFRVVHACWHQEYIDYLSSQLGPEARIPQALLWAALREPDSVRRGLTNDALSLSKAVAVLTAGLEVPLPNGFDLYRVRVRWWDADATTYRKAALLAEAELSALPDVLIPDYAPIDFPQDKPIFFGHYWLSGVPTVLSDKLACLDFSAAKGNPLVAYRWDGESILDNSKFVM